MSRDQWRAFLTEGTRTGKLATARRDGRPHVTPVWFVLDGDDLVFTTAERGVKGHNLRRDRRAALCVDDQRPPFAFVLVEGTVEISTDLPAVREWATTIAARYMGADLAEQYGERNGVPGELLCRLTPSRVIARSAIAD